MSRIVSPIVYLASLLACSSAWAGVGSDDKSFAPEQIQFFESQVRPILVEHCLGCHGEKKVKAGLRLDSRS
jgi:hypothetical protein